MASFLDSSSDDDGDLCVHVSEASTLSEAQGLHASSVSVPHVALTSLETQLLRMNIGDAKADRQLAEDDQSRRRRRDQARRLPPYVPRTVPTQLQCVWCGEAFALRAKSETGGSLIRQCGGGCKDYFICSETCQRADWDAGHKRVCERKAMK
jgi:hypothetical protein